MPAVKIIYTYLAMTAAFLAVDLIWLGIVAKNFYHDQIGHLMKATPDWPAALIFYALFIVGIMVFAVLPHYEKGTLYDTLLYGALFGFFTYMTYELTNYAVLKDWPLTIVFVDIVWGIVLSAVVSLAGYFVARI
jgi:uncharacterized membrane protein